MTASKKMNQAENNPGNGYFAVLPNNEETAQVVAYLRKHLSPDRSIRLRGQGQCTDGNSRGHYPFGLPVGAASHVRLYLTRDESGSRWYGRNAEQWYEAWRNENVSKQSYLSQLVNLKQALKELVK